MVSISYPSTVSSVDHTASPCPFFFINGVFSMGVGGCIGAEDLIYCMEKVVDNFRISVDPPWTTKIKSSK